MELAVLGTAKQPNQIQLPHLGMALLFVKMAEGVKPVAIQTGSVVQSNFLEQAERASDDLVRETLSKMTKDRLDTLVQALDLEVSKTPATEDMIDVLMVSFGKLRSPPSTSPPPAQGPAPDRYELSVETVGDGRCLMQCTVMTETTVADILEVVQPIADDHIGVRQYAMDFAVHAKGRCAIFAASDADNPPTDSLEDDTG